MGDTFGRVGGRRLTVGLAIAWLGVSAFAADARAEPGELDLSFDGDGVVRTSVGLAPGELSPEAVTRDGEGKLVVAGGVGPPGRMFGVARFTAAGELDPSFGGDGIVSTDVYTPNGFVDVNDGARSVLVDASGRVVVGGYAASSEVSGRPVVVRYLASGALDESFGDGGEVVLPLDFDELSIRDMALDADGGIIIGGSFGVVRLTEGGALDPSFANEGIYTGVETQGLAVDDTGRIYAVGGAGLVNINHFFAIALLTDDGDPDPVFGGGDGISTTEFGPDTHDVARDVSIAGDGLPVVAGTTSPAPGGRDFALVKYDEAGAPDAGFGGGAGSVVTDFGESRDDAESVLTTDDSIVVAGSLSDPVPSTAESDYGIARYDLDGNLDGSFGDDGLVRADAGRVPASDDDATGALLDSSGRILVAGATRAPGSSFRSAGLARFDSAGSLDPSFGEEGLAFPNPEVDSQDRSRAVMVDDQGRTVVAGVTNFDTTDRRAFVARYLPNGALDPAFGGGEGIVSSETVLEDVAAAAIADDGSVVAIGPRTGSIEGASMVRFAPGGDVDGLVQLPPPFERAGALAFDRQGRVVVLSGAAHGFALVRTTPTGEELDSTFGTNGIAQIPLPGGGEAGDAGALTVDRRNRIVAAGAMMAPTFFPAPLDYAVARVTQDGEPDPAFGGGNGVATTDLGGYDRASAVAIDPAGRIVVGGGSLEESPITLVRYKPRGALDPSFGGGDGKAVIDFAPSDSHVEGPGAALQIDRAGRIVVAGDTTHFDSATCGCNFRVDMAAARFMPSGRLDPLFGGGDGFVTTDLDGRADEAAALALDDEGGLVVAGASAESDRRRTDDDDLALARYEAGPDIPLPDTRIDAIRVRSGRAGVRVRFRGTDGTGRLRLRGVLDGEVAEPCRNPKRYRHLSRGRHVVTIRAVDAAGRVDPTPARRAFRIRR